MTSLNRPARLNRTLLTLLGLTLLAAGAFALATFSGRLDLLNRRTPLVPGTDTPPTWVLYATATIALVVGLLALRWLAAQLARRPKSRTWRLENDPGFGHTDLAATVATTPFTEDVTSYPGVHAAHATLAGTRQNPTLALVIHTEHGVNLAEVDQRLSTHALPRLRQALDLDTLPVSLEYRLTRHTGSRAL